MKKMRLVKTMVPLVAVSLMISGCSVQSVTYKGGSGTSAAASLLLITSKAPMAFSSTIAALAFAINTRLPEKPPRV